MNSMEVLTMWSQDDVHSLRIFWSKISIIHLHSNSSKRWIQFYYQVNSCLEGLLWVHRIWAQQISMAKFSQNTFDQITLVTRPLEIKCSLKSIEEVKQMIIGWNKTPIIALYSKIYTDLETANLHSIVRWIRWFTKYRHLSNHLSIILQRLTTLESMLCWTVTVM